MRQLKFKLAFLCALFVFLLLWACPALAQQKQWVDLVTGVENNAPVTTRVFGYYADVKGYGQVFIICDPNTGEETGYAYVPGGVVGNVKKQVIDHYDRKQDLDWDHPKQVNPPQVALIAPNIPTSTQWDEDYFRQTGQTVKKAVNQFGWPMSYGFARMIPGSDPNYWLIVASVSNPNPFPVTVSFDASIWSWMTEWGDSRGGPGKEATVPLGPNETKYVLLNVGQKNTYLADMLWNEWPDPGMSLASYDAVITQVNDPDYPDILKSGDKYGYFTTYVRWDGTNPTVLPLIPMRLAYDFSCSGIDYSAASYGSCNPTWGRGWYSTWGHAEYDPTTGQWSVGVYVDSDYRCSWWSDQEWNNFVQKFQNNATTALKRVFSTWYPKVPFLCSWWDDYLYVDGNTGYYYFSYDKKGWPNGQRPSFVIQFDYLEPVPPSTLPPGAKSLEEIYGPWYWMANITYGGWLYTTEGSYSHGVELPAPVLSSYRRTYYRGESTISEFNYQSYSAKERDDDDYDTVYVPEGTGIRINGTDVRYYDPRYWMDILPVLDARPLFVEWYTFVPTQGDIGYLKKDVVPGYLLQVSREHRPVLNTLTQPVEVRAKCGYVDWRNNSYKGVWREWRWTPDSEWQFLGETLGSTSGLSSNKAVWELTFNYSHTVSGNNPTDFAVSWTGSWGGVPSLYWPGKDTLNAKIAAMADWKTIEHYNPYYERYDTERVPCIDYLNVDPVISLPAVPTLAPNEQSKWLASCNKTASVRFWKTPTKYEGWDSYQNRVLNEIVTNIIQPIFSSQEEAVFNNGGKFVITPTFKTGEGGIVNGAIKALIHREYEWDSEDEWYVWNHLEDDLIGFPGAEITYCSYVTSSSPTGGLVVKGGDEYLADALSQKWTEIWFGYGYSETCSNRQWRYYYNGKVYPPPYPED